jgi:uncharacterized protein YjbI with pentapeptide repeats
MDDKMKNAQRLLLCLPLLITLMACKESAAKYTVGPNADLNGIVFGKKILSNTDLTGANLTDANLNSVDLTGSLLTSADLTRATSNKDTILKRANLDSALLARDRLHWRLSEWHKPF